MDANTLNYYYNNAADLRTRYNNVNSPLASLFPHYFQKDNRILDVGCGTGRDMAMLKHLGMDAYGLDPCKAFISQIPIDYPEIKKDHLFENALLDESLFEKINKRFNYPRPFDGILLSAVLMHIPEEELFNAAFRIKSLLKQNGIVIISHCTKRSDMKDITRDSNGRLMVLRSSTRILLLFKQLGFSQVGKYQRNDALGRDGIEWETLVLRFGGDERSESVDRINRVIKNDKKTSSYKLALLRSLCEIGQSLPHVASWRDGKVYIPLKEISLLWMRYFYPIIKYRDSDNLFIQQNKGAKIENGIITGDIAIRSILSKYSDSMTSSNKNEMSPSSLAQFLYDINTKGKQSKKFDSLIKEIVKKIIDMPMEHIKIQEENVFKATPDKQYLFMDDKLWYEFTTLGHWIESSIVFEWAEMTRSMCNSRIDLSTILEILLIKPETERYVQTAKSVYSKYLKSLTCVWSGKSIQKLNVDHAIPFTLRHDNSLWNLLPASHTTNANKSDKIPSSDLIFKSKDRIIYSWELLKTHAQEQFCAEAIYFMNGTGKLFENENWKSRLFNCFHEAMEITAGSRDVERWVGVD